VTGASREPAPVAKAGAPPPAPPAAATRLGRVAARLRGLHGDTRGQILPLVFFLGIAFFTGVILVANVGRTTSRRIEAQVAVDSAALSAATVEARGMNYVASNNVTMAKILTSIVILRSFDPAIGMSNGILMAWYGVAKGLQALQAVPYVGAALYAAGVAVEVVVGVECRILAILRKVVKPVRNFWDGKPDPTADSLYITTSSIVGPTTSYGTCPEKDPDTAMSTSDAQDETGKGSFATSPLGKALFGTCIGRKLATVTPNPKGNNFDPGGPKDGLGWKILKVLNHVGLVLTMWTPIQAQMAAKAMFRQNLAEPLANDDAWLLPVFPRLPICRAGFSKFSPEVQGRVEGFLDVIKIPGWVLLTLAMFPLTYKVSAEIEMTRMFDALDLGGEPPGNEALEEVEELQEEQTELGEDMEEAQEKKAEYQQKLAEERAGDADPSAIAFYEGQVAYWQGRIDAIQKQIETNQARITELTTQASGETGGNSFSIDMAEAPTGRNNLKQRALRPYLIDGKLWPTGYTYTVLAWREVPAAVLARVFPKPSAAIPLPVVSSVDFGRSFVYASGRLYNPSRADMWTPDWRSKLVRAEMRFFPTNPLGSLPASCGCSMIPEVDIHLEFDIDFIPNWDIDWPFEWPKFDLDYWLLLPNLNVPTSLGKH
jgi:hypothetical protein